MKHVGEEEPHYGLRKLSIGVASVLLGMSIYGAVGHADSVNSSENVSVDQSVNDSSLNNIDHLVLQSKQTASSTSSDENVVEGGAGNENVVNASDQHTSNLPQNTYVQSAVYESVDNASNNQFVPKQSQVSNVQFVITKDGSSTDEKASETTLGAGYFAVQGYKLQFDVDASQLKPNAILHIGDVLQTNNLNEDIAMYNETFDNVEVQSRGQNIGHVRITKENNGHSLSWDLVCDSNLSNFVGVQHISVATPHSFVFDYYQDLATFRGIRNPYMDLYWSTNPSKRYRINFVFNEHAYDIFHAPRGYDDGVQSSNFDGGVWLSDQDFNYFKSHNGRVLNGTKYHDVVTAYNIKGNNLYTPWLTESSWAHYSTAIYLVNSSGQVLGNVYVATDGSFVGAYPHPVRLVADDLTPKQLADLNVNGIVISKQKDGSYTYVSRVKPENFYCQDTPQMRARVKSELLAHSQIINADPDPEKAADNTVSYLYDVYHGLPMATVGCGQWVVSEIDPSVVSHVSISRLDLQTGKPLSLLKWNSQVSTTHANGQSTVKLHEIDVNNGNELQSIRNFVDWPDQGKKANLMISVPTGYQLVTANTSDILKRLNLTGTAITGNTQVDYPKENTISDYYVLLAPKTKNATINIVDVNENNKVLYSGQVSGAFNSVITGNDDVNSQLKKLLDSELYDLDHNGLSDGGLYKDGTNTVTISLKHHIDSAERHYRVIEDLPDGTEKVIIDVEATLYKDAAVPYYQTHGAYTPGNSKLLKQNEFNLLVGQDYGESFTFDDHFMSSIDHVLGYDYHVLDATGTYNNGVRIWDNKPKKTVDLDLFMGQDPSLPGGSAVDPLSSRDFHIIYTKNNYPVTISYYDTTGKQIATSTATHVYQDIVTASNAVPAGYVLLPGQTNQLTVGVDHNELDLLVAPTIQRSQEIKRVTRTIVYDDPNIKPVVQVVTLHHDKFTNIVNHSVAYGSWIADGANEFAAYVPLLKAGYVADPIAAEQVNGDSQDEMVNVHYQAINGRKEYKYIDVNGVGYDSLPTGDQIVNGQDLNKTGILIVKKPVPVINKIEYVKRIITVIMPNGRKKTIIQKTRKGGRFLKPHLPKLRGYNVDVNGSLDAMTANSDVNVTVKFVKM